MVMCKHVYIHVCRLVHDRRFVELVYGRGVWHGVRRGVGHGIWHGGMAWSRAWVMSQNVYTHVCRLVDDQLLVEVLVLP